jgi:cell division transport system permease protein
MRVGFFLKEAFRALRRSAAPSFAAMLTILITALVLGVFIPVVQATTGTANEVRGRVVVDVFVKTTATDAEKAALRTTLTGLAGVKSVQYIPKEQALAKMQKRNKEAFALLGSNPLPDSFRLTPTDPDGVKAIVDDLAPRAPAIDGGQRQPRLPAIDEVRNREQDTDKILSATGLVKGVTAGLAILFTLASVALVANTIRLSIFARRREVEVMKLVGATNWFIRWPFVIEGMIVGLLGGAMAVLLLTIGKQTFVDPLSDRFALLAAPDTINFGLLAAILLAACVCVSALGSGLTLRRFLRV